jgi:replicative DNA helicase
MIEFQFLKYLLTDTTKLSAVYNSQITSEFFVDEGVRRLFSIITDYYKKYKTPVTETVFNELISSFPEVLKKSLITTYYTSQNSILDSEMSFLVDSLRKSYKERVLKDTLLNSARLMEGGNVEDSVERLRKGITQIEVVNIENFKEGDIGTSVDSRWEIYQKRKQGIFEKTIYTGYSTIDSCTRGAQGGNLFVIQGWAKIGKSCLMLNIGYNVWLKGERVLYISAEVSKEELELRFDALSTGLPLDSIGYGRLGEDQELVYKNNLEMQKKKKNFYILDAPGCSTLFIKTKLQELQPLYNFGLILIDYIGLLTPAKRVESKWEAISEITLELRNIARSFNIPIISAAHINAAGKKKGLFGIEYTAGSTDIGKHADVIIGLRIKEDLQKLAGGMCTVEGAIIANRKGPCKEFILEANFAFMQMREVAILA